mmetsp:Transcript_4273/g.15053  ORF Transcript_4273/g.15053 Transcript_4273/m.15053 type:complete len:251 (-) Transcript_4273:1311-2063(-)
MVSTMSFFASARPPTSSHLTFGTLGAPNSSACAVWIRSNAGSRSLPVRLAPSLRRVSSVILLSPIAVLRFFERQLARERAARAWRSPAVHPAVCMAMEREKTLLPPVTATSLVADAQPESGRLSRNCWSTAYLCCSSGDSKRASWEKQLLKLPERSSTFVSVAMTVTVGGRERASEEAAERTSLLTLSFSAVTPERNALAINDSLCCCVAAFSRTDTFLRRSTAGRSEKASSNTASSEATVLLSMASTTS